MFVPRTRFTDKDLREAVAASRTYAETLRRLALRTAGGNHRTLQKYVALWGISTAHVDPHAARIAKLGQAPRPLDEVLVEGSMYSRGLLKQRLYSTGLKERRCELCGQGEEWRGRRMALILDHVNGVANDNRLENLRIVCPNCAATLDTHCGKNVNINRLCARCGTSFRPRGRDQRYCSHSCGGLSEASQRAQAAARRVERPPYAQLVREIERSSYVAVGRKYGVSDNAIRKWLRAYERELGAASLPRAA